MKPAKEAGGESAVERGPARSLHLLALLRVVAIAVILGVLFLVYRLGSYTHSIKVESRRSDFPSTLKVRLSKVVDADTIEVYALGNRERVQLLGVDGLELFRKEKKQVDGRLESEWVELDDPKATEAQEGLERFLRDKSLTLEFDRAEEQRDRYGRLLAWVWAVGGEGHRVLVNEWLIREGLAELRPGRAVLKYDRLLAEANAEQQRAAAP